MAPQCSPKVREQMFLYLENAFWVSHDHHRMYCTPYWHDCIITEKLDSIGSYIPFQPVSELVWLLQILGTGCLLGKESPCRQSKENLYFQMPHWVECDLRQFPLISVRHREEMYRDCAHQCSSTPRKASDTKQRNLFFPKGMQASAIHLRLQLTIARSQFSLVSLFWRLY